MPAESHPTPDIGEALELRHVFRAPRERVFAAFTDPDKLARWFGPKGVTPKITQFDLRVGGSYRLEMGQPDGSTRGLSGTYRHIEPPQRLIFTWIWDQGVLAGVETEVALDFNVHDSGTELVLTHTRLPSEEARTLHGKGWTGSFACLEETLQGEN